jgi:hypothetical protein
MFVCREVSFGNASDIAVGETSSDEPEEDDDDDDMDWDENDGGKSSYPFVEKCVEETSLFDMVKEERVALTQ